MATHFLKTPGARSLKLAQVLRMTEVEAREVFKIFYYGRRSIPAPLSLIGTEMDEHFGMSVHREVETVNDHFKRRLFEILSG